MNRLRAGISGLTTRGGSLLAAGLTLLFGALTLGQRDLLRASVFLLALPLCAIAVVSRMSYRLTATRRLDQPRVELGQSTTLHLSVQNVSRLPTGVLLVEELLPYPLGGPQRFVLDRIEPGGRREVSCPVQAQQRGSYRIGPLVVRLTDPFGLCELAHPFTATDDLIVTPAVSALPGLRLGGDWIGGGEATARSMSISGSDDIATREYRHGDDLRKVHWRSTARRGELMVRREEQALQSRATLLLDTRRGAHRGTGPDSSFEWSVSAVASIGVALRRSGFALHLLTANGVALAPPRVAVSEAIILDTLAVVALERLGSLEPAVTRLHRGGVDGVLIAVLGLLDVAEAERLTRLRGGTGICIALLVDVDTWAPGSNPADDSSPVGGQPSSSQQRVASLLVAAGWRVLPVVKGTALASVWPLAAGPAAQFGTRR